MKKIKWGIVGCGRIADQFCHDLAFTNNCELYAVAARDGNDANTFAAKFGAPKAYQGYQALFDDQEVDVVYIATPHNFHFQNASDAIKAGKHVLCEKPITISTQECQELSKLADKHNVFLMEAMWTYFLPAMQKAKEWIKQGHIGDIKHVKVDFGYPVKFNPNGREYNPDLAGGCLLDMGIYPLAISNFFLEQDLEDLHVKANIRYRGVEDDVTILAKSGDVTVNLATSFQCRLSNHAYIIGDKGYISIPDAFRAYECSLFELDDLIEHFSDGRESLGYSFEAEEVCNLLLDGKKESDIMSHSRSLLLQSQMERIKALF